MSRLQTNERERHLPTGLRDRLDFIRDHELSKVSYSELARVLGMNHETVRRIFRGGAPTAQFMGGLAKHYGISPLWLLLGEGPRRCAELAQWAMLQADVPELLHALAQKWTDLSHNLSLASRFLSRSDARAEAVNTTNGGWGGGIPIAGNGGVHAV